MSITTVKTPAPTDWHKAYEESEARLLRALSRNMDLRTALSDCMEIAGSDCEHDLCKAIIERAHEALRK